jgi:ribosomal protein S8
MTSDMVADTLTRVRNAGMAGHKVVKIRATLKTRRIVQLLHDEGYISSFESFTLPRHRDTKATERRKDRTGRTRKGVVSKFFLLKLKYVNVRSKGKSQASPYRGVEMSQQTRGTLLRTVTRSPGGQRR